MGGRRPPFPGQSDAWQLAMSKPAFGPSNATPEEFVAALQAADPRPSEPERNVADVNLLDGEQGQGGQEGELAR